jgi:hypothetical protein
MEQGEKDKHLPLAGWEAHWVQVSVLQLRKEEFTRCSIVASRTSVDDRHAELLEMASDQSALVVARSIKKEDCVPSPVRALVVEHFDQVREVERHDVLVGVDLGH